jgi:tol-pal system protein YbgF
VIGAGSTSPQDEQELYRSALKLLVEENKYDESIRMFQTYIDAFPQGRLLTNTLYWQGEAYLLVSAFPQAEAVFSRLLTEFPQDPKAAGAMLKLGKAYEGMGDSDKAEQVWQQLPSRYPESANEIRLARDYLNQ